MQNHDRRSLAPPSHRPRERWQHPDVARPGPLPSADPMVPELDPPEALTILDAFAVLSAEARRDLGAARRDGIAAVAL